MPLSSESYRRLAADLGYQQDTLESVRSPWQRGWVAWSFDVMRGYGP